MSLVDSFWSGPPVTRTWAVCTFAMSLALHAKLLDPGRVIYDFDSIFQARPELWRLLTPFCFTGQLGIIFDPFLIWTNAGWLEHECQRFSREPGKFLVYLMFVAVITLLFDTTLWGSRVFTRPLIIAIIYTWSQHNRGRPTNVYFVTLDAKFVWPALVFVDFLMFGLSAALNDLGGVVAAHSYDFLTIYWPKYGGGRNIFFTPSVVAGWFGATRPPNTSGTSSGESGGRSSAATTGFSSWNSRGQGRRLGGD